MQFTRRAARSRRSLAACVLVAGVAGFVIIGLLGMHFIATNLVVRHDDLASHPASIASASSIALDPDVTADTSMDDPMLCGGVCVTGVGSAYSMMLTCVLALMAGFLFLVPPLAGARADADPTALVSSLRLLVTRARPRCLSLTELSISRT
ncbi:DUF6153 family protein [Enemella dayhoffiae]|nr:DUF6153 family protein [Enemella dayhoffiae]